MKTILTLLLIFLPLSLSADESAAFGNAKWIGATADAHDSLAGRSIILSKVIDCPWSDVSYAKALVCGLGFYEMYIDGKKVNGEEMLAPAWSDYDKTVFYNAIDVSKFMTKGRHTIEIWLGNGFYHESGGRYHKLTTNFGPLTLLFNLQVFKGRYDVVRSYSVVSDSSWQWRLSPITFNSIYGGEDYDARLETTAGESDAHAVVQPAPKGALRMQRCGPVAIMERYGLKRRLAGNVYDMGQNLAGFPEITVRGQRGQRIKLIVGESLRKDGHVSQKETGKPHFYVYTLKGDSVEKWHPRFSYYSFRYIEIEPVTSADSVDGSKGSGSPASEGPVRGQSNCPANGPEIMNIQSCFIYNTAASEDKAGTFECSNTLFNATYNIIDKAIKSNWMSIWTDCPSREKLGWMEQDWLNGEGLMTNYDCRKMIEQEMIVIADAQHADGSMPEIAPEYIRFEGSWAPPFQESPEWGGAIVALPFLYKEFYGDDKLVKKYLPQMRQYTDYLATRDSAYILSMGLGDWYDYGPWRAGFSRNTPRWIVSTAHYYLWNKLVGNRARADSIKHAFLNHLSSSGFTHLSQTALAIMIDLGLYDDGQRQTLLDSLVADIHSHGDRLTTGDIGTRYLFRVLTDNGQEDLLYNMLNHTDPPGYGAQIAKGMTTLTEQWNPDRGASHNHFMLGHIDNHLVPDIGGIHIRNGKAYITPLPIGDIVWCKASAVVGGKRIRTDWKINDGVFMLNVSAPDKKNIKIDYEKINSMCVKRHLRLHYKFKRSE